MKRLWVLIFILGLGVVAGEQKSFSVGDNPSLDLENISGPITVSQGESNAIVIKWEKEDDRTEVDISQKGDKITVKTQYPRGARNIKGGVVYQIQFPAKGNIRIQTTSGSLSADQIQGDIFLKTISGQIEGSRLSGNLEVKTVSGAVTLQDLGDFEGEIGTVAGNINVMGRISGGDVEFNATSGSITLEFKEDSSFDVSARSVSGGITSKYDEIQITRAKYGPSTSAKGSVNGGAANVSVSTVSGSIVLK